MTASPIVTSAWTDPEPELVAPDTWRVALPLQEAGLAAVNCYVVRGRDRTLLVDPGTADPGSVDRVEEVLGDLGVTGEVVAVSTHIHSDHYPGAVALRRRRGTTVALGAGERDSQARIPVQPSSLAPQIELLRGYGADELAARIERDLDGDFDRSGYETPDRWLVDGDVLDLGGRRLRVIATPGHTRGHVVLHEGAAGVLFTGDHVLPRITPSFGFEAAPADHPLADFLASQTLLLDGPDARLLPAHGPVGPSVHDRVRELLDHHDHRLAVCRELVAAEGRPVTAATVAETMRWTTRDRAFADLDLLGQLLAVLEAGEHLALLVDRGALVAADRAGVARFADALDRPDGGE